MIDRVYFLRLLVACAALLWAGPVGAAPAPAGLRQTFTAPANAAQTNANLGASVATDGALTIVGAPGVNAGARAAGAAKVYDSASGELLHILSNPEAADDDRFGGAVAISGRRVAVAETNGYRPGRVYVYDLSSANPTVPTLTLSNPATAPNGRFGHSLAFSDNRLVVGAPALFSSSATSYVYVYDLAGATPTAAVFTLTGDYHFGCSVSLAGSRLAVGAYGRYLEGHTGRAYVYDLSGSTPALVFSVTDPQGAQNSNFGYAVALHGTRLVVGMPKGIFGNYTAPGRAYVYDFAGSSPSTPLTILLATGTDYDEDDLFGCSVAISASRILIGAENGVNLVSQAHVYQFNGSYVGTLTRNPNSSFGCAVALSGTQAVIGASDDDARATNAGSAFVYQLGGALPTQPSATLDTPSPIGGDRFGSALAMDGSRVLVGATGNDLGSTDAGCVFLYDLQAADASVPQLTFANPSPSSGDLFGSAAAITGQWVIIGARGKSNGAGTAYVYDLNGPTPTTPVAGLLRTSSRASDNFGGVIAASGHWVAVGADFDDTYYYNAGAVYVYDLRRAELSQPVHAIHDPTLQIEQYFGRALALSGDRLVVGAEGYRAGSGRPGRAYVFDLVGSSPTSPVRTLSNPAAGNFTRFGRSIALAGDTALVGAASLTGTGGGAWVYALAGTTPDAPLFALQHPSSTTDQFGAVLAVTGTRAMVGASTHENAGRVYLYDLAGATPEEPVGLLENPAPGPATGDQFGSSIATNRLGILVGAPFEDAAGLDHGVAYLFGPTAVPVLATPVSGTASQAPIHVAFEVPPDILPGSLHLEFAPQLGSNLRRLWLAPSEETAGPHQFSFSPLDPTAHPSIVSGSSILDGPYTVTIRCRDSLGQLSSIPAENVWIDNAAPQLDHPANIVAEATSPAGATVSFTATSRDPAGSGVKDFQVEPPSGTVFPLGTSSVQVTASDHAGNSATTSFHLTVEDTTSPVVSTSLVAQHRPAGPGGRTPMPDFTAAVRALASDAVGTLTVTQTPSPGTIVGRGTQTLQFVVRDTAGNQTTTTSAVTFDFVRPPATSAEIVQATRTLAPAGPPEGTVLSAFGTPAISDERTMVARVTMTAGAQKLAGIYLEDGAGEATLPAFQGGPTGLPELSFQGGFSDPVIAPGGAIAFRASLKGRGVTAANNDSVWTTAFNGTLQLALREDTPLAVLTGAAIKSFHGLSVRDGELLVLVKLKGPGVTATNNLALLRQRGLNAIEVLGRNNAPHPSLGFSPQSVSIFTPAPGSPGHGRWHGDSVIARVAGLDRDRRPLSLIVRFPPSGGTEPIIVSGMNNLPGAPPEVTIARFGLPAIDPTGTEIGLRGYFKLGAGGIIHPLNDEVLAHFGPRGLIPTALEANPASPTGGSIWASFFDPLVNDAGTIAFLAKLRGDDLGLWWGDPLELSRVAQIRRNTVPDAAGEIVARREWAALTSVALPSGPGGAPVIVARIKGPGITAANQTALYAVDSTGRLRELLRTRDEIGDKPVAAFTLLEAVSGAGGVARSYNATGSLALRVTFTDRTQALVRLDIP